jgi:hypothetical protein
VPGLLIVDERDERPGIGQDGRRQRFASSSNISPKASLVLCATLGPLP